MLLVTPTGVEIHAATLRPTAAGDAIASRPVLSWIDWIDRDLGTEPDPRWEHALQECLDTLLQHPSSHA